MSGQHDSLPFLPIRVRKDNLHDDLRLILKELRPEWQPELIKFKQSPKSVTQGVINTMVMAYITQPCDDGVTCRVYGEGLFRDKITSGREIDYIQLVRRHFDFVPNILVKFENGYCYDYIDGEILTPEKIRLDPIWRIIAKQVAQIHSLPVPEDLQISSKINEFFFNTAEYPESLKDEKLNMRLHTEYPSKDVYYKDHADIIKMIEDFGSPLLLQHGDLRPENMVWNEKSGKVTFVDFECAAFDIQTMDIAYHFFRFTGIQDMDYSLFPSETFQRDWLRVYLEELYERTGKRKEDVREKNIEALRAKVLKTYLVMILGTVASTPSLYADGTLEQLSDLAVDFFEMGARSYQEYIRVKDDIMGMAIPE